MESDVLLQVDDVKNSRNKQMKSIRCVPQKGHKNKTSQSWLTGRIFTNAINNPRFSSALRNFKTKAAICDSISH